jgi:hypothetical protein
MADLRVEPDGDHRRDPPALRAGIRNASIRSKDKSLHDLAEIIAETMSVHAAATELLEHAKPGTSPLSITIRHRSLLAPLHALSRGQGRARLRSRSGASIKASSPALTAITT